MRLQLCQTFGEISRRVAEAAFDLKVLPNRDVEQINGEEANTLLPHGNVLYGINARAPPNRARAILGWTPREESLEKKKYAAWWLRKLGPWVFSEAKTPCFAALKSIVSNV